MNWWKIMPFFCYFTFFHLVPIIDFTYFTIFPSSQWFFSFFLQCGQFHEFFVNSIIFLHFFCTTTSFTNFPWIQWFFISYYLRNNLQPISQIFCEFNNFPPFLYYKFHEFSVNSMIFASLFLQLQLFFISFPRIWSLVFGLASGNLLYFKAQNRRIFLGQKMKMKGENVDL